MATTTPDNIQYPVNSDQVAPLASHFKNLADSTQSALNTKADDADLTTEITNRTNADALKVAKAGDTMTGALILSGDPTLALHAATKQYVDTADAALQTQITSNLQTSRVYVKNGATALTKGTPVYVTGADGTNIIIGAASNASEATSSKVIGLTETDLAINGMGYVVTDGKLSNIDTSGAGAAGDAVWLGVNGAKLYGLSNKPVAPAHMVYLGVVSRKNANTGEIQVKVQNGFELNELHDVLIVDPQNKQVVAYEDGLWKNKQATGGVTVGATAPTGPNPGDAWYNSNNGMLYVWYVDADSTAQWVQVKANSGLEASILSRLGGLEAQAIAYGTQSPNYVINGGFDIWQRGTSVAMGTTSYTADRWFGYRGTGGATTSRVAGTGSQYAAKVQRNSGNTSTEWLYLSQSVETLNSIPLAGKTVTVSFYAKSGANFSGSNMNFSWFSGTGTDQNFILAITGQVALANTNISLTSTLTRYSFTATVPANSTQTGFWFGYIPSGTAGADDSFTVERVQLEVGSTATSFRRNQPNIQAELAACQRYYYRHVSMGAYAILSTGYAISTTAAQTFLNHPVTMRTKPTSLTYGGTLRISTYAANFTFSTLTLAGVYGGADVSVIEIGGISPNLTYGQGATLLSLNDTTAYIAVDAEL